MPLLQINVLFVAFGGPPVLDGVTLAEYLDGRAGLLLAGGGVAAAFAQLAVFWRPTTAQPG